MRLQIILSLFLLPPSSDLLAQPGEESLQKFVKKEKLDSFFIYNRICVGYINLNPDTCRNSDIQYLFWVKRGKFYLKKFTRCEVSQTFRIKTDNPFNYYLDHRSVIDSEEIRMPTVITYKKTATGIDTIMNSTAIDHSCHHQFRTQLDTTTLKMSVDEFDLETQDVAISPSAKSRNIYYEHNQATLTKQLIERLKTFASFYAED